MAEIKKDVTYIKDSLTRNFEDHDKIFKYMKEINAEQKDAIKCLDKKFASKWVEKAAIVLCTTILLSILYAILELVVKK